jgi:DNA-binding NarL/FixJ family response regulator
MAVTPYSCEHVADGCTANHSREKHGGDEMKILIADDHELFRDGLRHVLDQFEGPPTIVEASDFPQAIAAVQAQKDIEIVLLDLSMPGMAWTEGLAKLKELLPADVPLIVLSASDDRRHVLQAVNMGAAGFIPKTSSSRVMLSALKLVLSGGVYLPPALLDQSGPGGDDGAPMAGGSAIASLTPRQREVLALLGQGKSNKEIARVLELAEGTVKLHVTAILKALNVNNRTRAVVAASHLGLNSPDVAV